jgi:hypothetical protein
MRLRKRQRERVPAMDTGALYARIFRERYGPWGMAIAVGRKMLGLKV